MFKNRICDVVTKWYQSSHHVVTMLYTRCIQVVPSQEQSYYQVETRHLHKLSEAWFQIGNKLVFDLRQLGCSLCTTKRPYNDHFSTTWWVHFQKSFSLNCRLYMYICPGQRNIFVARTVKNGEESFSHNNPLPHL